MLWLAYFQLQVREMLTRSYHNLNHNTSNTAQMEKICTVIPKVVFYVENDVKYIKEAKKKKVGRIKGSQKKKFSVIKKKNK